MEPFNPQDLAWVARPRRDALGNPTSELYASCRLVEACSNGKVTINSSEGLIEVPVAECYQDADDCCKANGLPISGGRTAAS